MTRPACLRLSGQAANPSSHCILTKVLKQRLFHIHVTSMGKLFTRITKQYNSRDWEDTVIQGLAEAWSPRLIALALVYKSP